MRTNMQSPRCSVVHTFGCAYTNHASQKSDVFNSEPSHLNGNECHKRSVCQTCAKSFFATDPMASPNVPWLSKLRRMDAYPKTIEEFKVRTMQGGVCT